MIENGFYILDKSYAELVKSYNGEFEDQKSRPIFCCLKDKKIEGLYWLIPTSDLSHRTPEQIQKYYDLSQVKDIRQAYYYVGHTTKPALFKISKVLPVTDKYISHEYKMQGNHLVMQDKAQIAEINQRLQRILAYEAQYPNKLEQKITAVKEHICKELQQEINEAKHVIPQQTDADKKFDNKEMNDNSKPKAENVNSKQECEQKPPVKNAAASHKTFFQGVDELAKRHSGQGTSKPPTHNSTDETLNGNDSKFRK